MAYEWKTNKQKKRKKKNRKQTTNDRSRQNNATREKNRIYDNQSWWYVKGIASRGW